MNDLLNLIGNVGFPIAVTAYLLIRIENKLSELSGAINELREAVITLPAANIRNGCLPSPQAAEGFLVPPS
ncbi:MAG: YvrJ family protein [Deltaproteobacteria bacterium]